MVDVLVVGPGAIAKQHVQSFRLAGANVVGVAGRDAARARAFADALDIPHAFEGHRAALDACDAQIVTVATPPSSHCEITVDSLAAGRDVLCEKPFAMSADEARRMAAAARDNDRLLGCWSSRHQYKATRHLLDGTFTRFADRGESPLSEWEAWELADAETGEAALFGLRLRSADETRTFEGQRSWTVTLPPGGAVVLHQSAGS